MDTSKEGNITRRLMLSFSVLISVFLLFGLFTLYSTHTLSSLTQEIYNHPLVVSNAALQAFISVTKMHRSMKDVVLFDSSPRIQQSIKAVNEQEQQVYKHLDIVKNRILGDEGRALENQARMLFDDWRPIREEVISLVLADQREKAADITIGKGAHHVAELEEKMLGLTNYATNKASFFMNAVNKAHSRVVLVSIFFLLSGILVSTLVATFTLKGTSLAEKKLRQSKQLLTDVIDFAPTGMVQLNPDGKFHHVNQAFCEMTGYEEQELCKTTFQELNHPDDYDMGPETFQKLLNGEVNKASLESRYLKKDGSIIDVLLTISLLNDDEGRPLYILGQARDITERKRAEEALRKSEGRYRSYIEVTGQLGWTTNAHGEVVEDIPSWRRFTGQSEAEVKGLRKNNFSFCWL